MSFNRKMSQRIGEESRLLMEQKWIKDALAKIKTQRNCLQIERLVLESMKSQEKIGLGSPQYTSMSTSEHSAQYEDMTSKLDCDEQTCNNEELNLDMSMFSNMNPHTPMEEEDDDNPDNVVIDVNMLMNGHQ